MQLLTHKQTIVKVNNGSDSLFDDGSHRVSDFDTNFHVRV